MDIHSLDIPTYIYMHIYTVYKDIYMVYLYLKRIEKNKMMITGDAVTAHFLIKHVIKHSRQRESSTCENTTRDTEHRQRKQQQ